MRTHRITAIPGDGVSKRMSPRQALKSCRPRPRTMADLLSISLISAGASNITDHRDIPRSRDALGIQAGDMPIVRPAC